ncbi:MAG: sensor histidine kinase [Clostridia bacterium]
MKALFKQLLSLRFSILAIVLLCWLIPTVLLGSYLGSRFFGALKEKTEVFLMTSAQQAQVRTMENINAVVTLGKDAIYDGELYEAVSGYAQGDINYETYFAKCRSYLERKYGRERLLDFTLFFKIQNPTGIFFTTDDYPEAVYFQLNVLSQVMEMSAELDTDCRFFAQGGRMYMVRNLFDTKMQKYGIIVMGINEERLFTPITEACEKLGMKSMVQLDQFLSGDERFLNVENGMSEVDDTLLYTQSTQTRDYSLSIQVQADKREVYREMVTFRSIMVWMFVLLIPICLLIMTFVSQRITRPIRYLNDAAVRIRGGELGVTVPIHGTDELGQLGSAFSSMSVQLKYLVDQSYKEEIALRDARIQAMQSRINSHFLNNALETINWQARMENSETIATMVEALSCLLNASMDRNERHLVPLKEELVVADAYFYFVGLRFGEKLTVWKNVEDGLGDLLVPRLAIQTLVENAIEHGIAPMGGGRINLTIFKRKDQLNIEVINNGKKLSDEDLTRIRRLLSNDKDSQGHMGIRNVSRRLKLLYGDKASLTLHADERGQTVAAFVIPCTHENVQGELLTSVSNNSFTSATNNDKQ